MYTTLARFFAAIALTLVVVACSSPSGSVASVAIDGGDQSTLLGTALTLTATVVTTGGASDAVVWESSDESVATIDMAGNVTSIAVGTANISATSTVDPSKSDTIILTVDPIDGVDSVAIDGGNQSTDLGSALTLTATVVTTGDASDAVVWASSDESVATIDTAGSVSSFAVGAAAITATSTVDATKSDTIILTVDPRGVLKWTRQFGTTELDAVTGIATDPAGNVYATGLTLGALDGASAGGFDVFVRSYGGDGSLRWSRQFGTSYEEQSRGIATDANGNVYAAGYTFGDLEGGSFGSRDVFLRSYNSDGTLRWTRQFGTGVANSVATDAEGNVYVAGDTVGGVDGPTAGGNDAFIRSYDSDGTLRWTRQFGTSSDDYAMGVATDTNGNVYVTGHTLGALEGPIAINTDVFIRSYDGDGNVRWTRQFSSDNADYASSVVADAYGNVYVAGHTFGGLEGPTAGGDDAFIRSYDSDGTLRWTRQFGTSSGDYATGLATDTNGNVYAAGYTLGALEGPSAGLDDAFLRAYDREGNLHWTRQFGTSGSDAALAIATDSNANVYAAGGTYGDLEGVGNGEADAFVRKFAP